MDTGVIISIILAVIGVAITVVIWVASTRAVRFQQAQEANDTRIRTVDEDAYERAQRIYEGITRQLEAEAARLNSQVAELRQEVTKLNEEIIAMRKRGYRDLNDSGPQPKVT